MQEYQTISLSDARAELEKQERTYYEEQALTNPLCTHIMLQDETVETLLKIDRVLRQPVGHLLLVGVSGVGKTLLSRFAAFINGYEVHEIKTHKKYSL